LKHNKGAVDKNLPLDEIDISDIDLDFIRDITLSDTYDYLEYMAQSRPTQQNSNHTNYGLSVNSRARKVSAIRAFFRYLTDKQHVLEVNPVSGLEAPTVRKSLPTYLTTDDSVRLLESVTGPYAERDYCILTFFLNCGMRVSELVGLNLTDFKDDTVRVLGKGGKQRTVFLNDACLAALGNLPKRLEPVSKARTLFVSSATASMCRRSSGC
ncbi:MAG: tyrosine-type recombinase/integrase, partial [Butyricicoccus sp.]